MRVIIDSHCHANIFKRQSWSDEIGVLLSEMQRAGVGRACLMPWSRYPGYLHPNKEDMIEQGRTLTEIAACYPDTFYPMYMISPTLSTSFLIDAIGEYVLNGPIAGLKFHVAMPVGDKRLDPLYAFIEKHDIPVLYHSWYKTADRCEFESTPADIAVMAGNFPGIRIINAHLTGSRIRGIYDIQPYPNIYMDTSASQPEDGYLQTAIDELGADRILFGSDYCARAYSTQLARIDSIALTPEEREKIMCNNALQFFGRRRSAHA